MQRQEIHSLYIVKALAALFVVIAHIPMWGSEALWVPMNLAVPLFYMITGYFTFSHDKATHIKRTTKSARKALLLLWLVNAVHFVWLFPNHGSKIYSWEHLLHIILGFDFLTIQLWYLSALIYGLIILALVYRWLGTKGLYPFVLLVGLNLVQGKYAMLLGGHTTNVMSLWHNALPFLALGMLIKAHESRLMSYKWLGPVWILVGLSVLEALLCHLYLPFRRGIFILTAPLAFGLICLCLQYKSYGARSWLSHCGKHLSGSIYYFHILMATLVHKALAPINGAYSLVGALGAFALSVVLAEVIYRLQRRVGVSIF